MWWTRPGSSHRFDAVADAASGGGRCGGVCLQDEDRGQGVQAGVQAVVQPVAPGAGDAPLDEAALRDSLLAWCRQQRAGFKLPRDIAFAALPRNDVGKMARAAVRARLVVGSLGPWCGR